MELLFGCWAMAAAAFFVGLAVGLKLSKGSLSERERLEQYQQAFTAGRLHEATVRARKSAIHRTEEVVRPVDNPVRPDYILGPGGR